MSVVRNLLVKLGFQVDERQLARAGERIRAAGDAMDTAGSSADRMADRVRNAVAAFLGFEAARRAATALVSDIMDAEGLRTQFVTITGSVAEANDEFDRLQSLAERTPFNLKRIGDSYALLGSQGLDTSTEALTDWGNLAAGRKKDITQSAEAVADAVTGEFERLKEFGIVARSEGNKVSFTFKGVTRTVTKDAKSIENALRDISRENFAGAMERQSKTLAGRLSTLRDRAFGFAIAVGEAGLLDALKELVEEFLDVSEEGGGLAKVLGRVLGRAVRGVTRVIRWARENSHELKEGLRLLIITAGSAKGLQVFLGIMKALNAVTTAAAIKILLIVGALVLLGLIVEDLIVFAQGGDSVIGGLLGDGKEAEEFKAMLQSIASQLKQTWEQLKPTLMSLLEVVIDALPWIVKGLLWVIEAVVWLVDNFIAGLRVIGYALGTAAAAVYVWVQDVISWFGELYVGIVEVLEDIGSFFAGIWAGIVGVVSAVVDWIVDTWNSITEPFKELWDGLLEYFRGVTDAIGEKLDMIIAKAASAMKKTAEALGIQDDVERFVAGARNTGNSPLAEARRQVEEERRRRALNQRRANAGLAPIDFATNPAGTSRGGRTVNAPVEMKVEINGTNLSEEELQRSVRNAAEEAMGGALLNAFRDVGEAY